MRYEVWRGGPIGWLSVYDTVYWSVTSYTDVACNVGQVCNYQVFAVTLVAPSDGTGLVIAVASHV